MSQLREILSHSLALAGSVIQEVITGEGEEALFGNPPTPPPFTDLLHPISSTLVGSSQPDSPDPEIGVGAEGATPRVENAIL